MRAMVITGSGQAYCAGLDLSMATDKALAAGVGSGETPRDTAGRFTLTVFDMKTPVIAAINGAAVGVGVTMTLPMDIRIASDQARFGFIFNRRGLVPEGCSTWFLPRLVGVLPGGRMADHRPDIQRRRSPGRGPDQPRRPPG